MAETNSKKSDVLGPMSRGRALKDVAWVAAFLNVSKSWVYQATSSGTLPCIRIGAALRFDAEVIRAWVRGETSALSVKLPGCR
jgi:excisionase family DNA binding protein